MAEGDLIYLYGVTNKIPKLKEIENIANNIFFVYHGGLYAIVGKVKESEFSEENLKKNLADLEWIKIKAGIHEKVIEGIMNPTPSASKRRCEVRKGGMKNTCVIPFKFATLFNTEDNLKTMLGAHLEEFKDILIKLEDKEEWGVKIYCDLEKLKEVIIQEDGEILKLDKEINSSSTGKAYLLNKKKEELLNIATNKKLNEYGQISFDRLRQMSEEARINKLLPKEVTERKDEMILNSAFLVGKNKVNNLLKVVEELKIMFNGKGLFFDCTGPWPPYNFCHSKEKTHNG
jgi:hypothetical protein